MIRIPLWILFAFLVAGASVAGEQWREEESGTRARFRGVSVVNSQVAWASGTGGTFARTIDAGGRWRSAVVPGAESLDFRDVEGVDASTAYLLSIGEGELSRIYKTANGGKSWTLQFTNRNSKAFFDAFAFWDATHGIAMSDPVDGRFVLITTDDGGRNWKELRPEQMPPALPGESAFAASGTCIAVHGNAKVWFGTGGGEQARVFRSNDRGRTWEVAEAPITAGSSSAGIFSIAFLDARRGVVVGGDYKKENEPSDNVAVTRDGGKTWSLARRSLPGYRSGVSVVRTAGGSLLIAVGPSGADISKDEGVHWESLGTLGFHAIGLAGSGAAGWAVGENGRIAKYSSRASSKNAR